MKQVSKTRNSSVPGSIHYSMLLKRSFPKYLFVFLFAFIIMYSTSCKKNELQDNSQNHEMISSDAKKAGNTRCVPFKASFTTFDEMTQAGTDENPIQKDHLTGTGVGTEIGRASIEVFAEGDITLPFPALVTSIATYTAANGDKIFTTGWGYVEEPSANGDLHLTGGATITGGTGRFAGVTGTWVADVTGNIFKPQGTLAITGTICYPAQ